MQTQSIYQKAILFAAKKHSENHQTIPGTNLPYIVHLSNVAMEIMIAYQKTNDFNLDLALPLALLHDTLEDTATTTEELLQEFGLEVSKGVMALSKNKNLPKSEQMQDSLNRIKMLSKEVGIVKIADRITNLQEPPKYWTTSKKQEYQKEALLILEHLKGANTYLEQRLHAKIIDYEKYIL